MPLLMLSVLRKYDLVTTEGRFTHYMRLVRYPGFIFGVRGISADPDKLAVVHEIPTSVNRNKPSQTIFVIW